MYHPETADKATDTITPGDFRSTGEPPTLTSNGHYPKVEPAVRAMQARPEASWTVESLAEAAQMSRSVFAERFLAEVGVTPGHYLLECRMHLASELLMNRSLGIKEIAARVGYGSESSFGNAFKRWAGMPPGAFRASGREQVGTAPPPPTIA